MGRSDRVRESLSRAWTTHRVVLAQGPPGAGKSVAAAAVAPSTAVFIRLRPANLDASAAPQVIAALESALRVELRADDADPIARLIDAAEQAELCVVVDGLERGHDDAEQLLNALALHARRTRWLATSRSLSTRAPGACSVTVEPWAAADVEALLGADGWRSTRGLARRVHQRLVGAEPQLVGEHNEPPLLHGELKALVTLLAHTEAVVSIATVTEWGGDAGALAASLATGALVQDRRGIGLAPAAAGVVRDLCPLEPSAATHRWIQLLAAEATKASRHALSFAALRISIATGALDTALDLVRSFYVDWLDAGLATELWHALRHVMSPELASWRDMSAIDAGAIGTVDVDALGDGHDTDLVRRYAYGRALAIRGDLERANAVVTALLEAIGSEALADHPDANPRLVARVYLLGIPLANNLGDHARAVVYARAMPAATLVDRVNREAGLGGSLAYVRQWDEARTIIERIWQQVRDHTESIPRSSLARLAASAYEVDARAIASALVEPLARKLTTPHTSSDREPLVIAAQVALDDGRLDDAERSLTALDAEHSPAYNDACVRLMRARLALERGDAAHCASALVPPSDQLMRWQDHAEHARTAAELAIVTGSSAPRYGDLEPVAVINEVMSLTDLAVARHALRWQQCPPPTQTVRWTEHKRGTRAGFVARFRAEQQLLDGDHAAARASAVRASDAADAAGYQALAIATRLLQAEIGLITSETDDIDTPLDEAEALARRFGFERFTREVCGLRGLLGGPDWPALQRLASDTGVAGRRARALLKLAPSSELDAIDRAVVAAVSRGVDAATRRRIGTGGEPQWGCIQHRRLVWAADGQSVELSRRSIAWRVLAALLGHTVPRTRQDLLRDVWDITQYRPHEHDNRLSVAIYKLRRTLPDPQIIDRTDDGYLLAGSYLLA